MALGTYSKFYYVDPVTTTNLYFDFNEGAGELSAIIALGSYSPTDLASALASSLNSAGTNGYAVSFDRTTREYTISALSGTIEILVATGVHAGTGIYSIMGLGAVDLASASSHTGSAAGTSYNPQFLLQGYTPAEHFQKSVSGTVNETASGEIETVKFGSRKFIEFEITYSNSLSREKFEIIKSDTSAVDSLVSFMEFGINKYPFEFMPDEDSPNVFYKVKIESTEADPMGLGFKLKEMTDAKLSGFYKTGMIKLRVV